METKELEARIRQLEAKLEEATKNKDLWYNEYMRLLSKIAAYKEASNAIMNMLNA